MFKCTVTYEIDASEEEARRRLDEFHEKWGMRDPEEDKMSIEAVLANLVYLHVAGGDFEDIVSEVDNQVTKV